ncbi:hypothetical protein N7G274_005614 [Stereocaulon virgatum]|uniref:Uncharacterized protein n=1 Tax=Stereocaulon virgatum TaxID=373712 RepID=A0ABR4A8L8_9LECA
MFSSLPPLFSHDPHTLWYPSLSTNPPPPPPSSHDCPTNNALYPSYQQHHHRTTQPPQPPQRTLLSILRTDETIVSHRKANIRRFGAGWLRPPGVAKTLQGMYDERAEREEVEGARAREFAAQEAQMAAEAEAEGLGMGMGMGMEGDGGERGVLGRDLDDEVPDLDADGGAWSDADGTEDEGEGELGPTEAHGEGLLEEEGGGIMWRVLGGWGRDLDDEIPDADADADQSGVQGGEYEHTDTEVEASSSEDDGGVVQRQGPVMGTFRQSGNAFAQRRMDPTSSGALGNSFFGSSPVGTRDSLGGRGGGRRSRGRGREN